jgi:hypothetical protein
MAGLVPAIHVLNFPRTKKDVDARHKAGHSEGGFDPSGYARYHKSEFT